MSTEDLVDALEKFMRRRMAEPEPGPDHANRAAWFVTELRSAQYKLTEFTEQAERLLSWPHDKHYMPSGDHRRQRAVPQPEATKVHVGEASEDRPQVDEEVREQDPPKALPTSVQVLTLLTAQCRICGKRIEWVTSPTGGWWHHLRHPADEHDAVTFDDWQPDEEFEEEHGLG